MRTYLVELYSARSASSDISAAVARVRATAAQISREGTPVRYVRSIFLPGDETCFYLFEATSAKAVHQAAERAEIQFERIVEAVAEDT